MLFNNTIINIVSDQFKKLGWEIHPPISLIGSERPAISAFKNGVRFDVTVFLGEDNISNEEILSIQKQYIQQNIHYLALVEETPIFFFYQLSNYRTDYLKIYTFKNNNHVFFVRDLMELIPTYEEPHIKLTDLIYTLVHKDTFNYFIKLEKSYDEYHEKQAFFRKYLIFYGVLYTIICEIISKLHISLIPKELTNLLAPISPNIRFTIKFDFVASFYSSIYLYMLFVLLLYIIKFKRIYHPIIGDENEQWEVKQESNLFF